MSAIILTCGRGWANEEGERAPASVLFYITSPDVQRLLNAYDSSAVKRFLHDPAISRFVQPGISHINNLVIFWLDHFALNRVKIEGIVKDSMTFTLVRVPNNEKASAFNSVSILTTGYNEGSLTQWLAEFEKKLPADARKKTETINGIPFTHLHYFIKVPASGSDMASKGKEGLTLPSSSFVKEEEVSLSYGHDSTIFFLSWDNPERLKRIFSETSVSDFLRTTSHVSADTATPEVRMVLNLTSLRLTGNVRGKFFQAMNSLFGVNDASLRILFMPDAFRLEGDFPTKPIPEKKHEERKEYSPSNGLTLIPHDADYVVLAVFDWHDAWNWFDLNVKDFSEKFDRYQKAILRNFNATGNLQVQDIFIKGLGNETALFPYSYTIDDFPEPVRRTIFYVKTGDRDTLVRVLRIVLTLIGNITHFRLMEDTIHDGTLFVFREERPMMSEYAKLVCFWVGKEFSLISGSPLAIDRILGGAVGGYDISVQRPAPDRATAERPLIIHWETFDLSPLLRDILQVTDAFAVDLEAFNREVLDLSSYIPPQAFRQYFGRGALAVSKRPSCITINFTVEYK